MTAGRGRAERVDLAAIEEPELAAAWGRLAELRENPFLTLEWYRAWLDTHPDEDPFPVVWWRGDDIRGVLPLVRASIGPLRVLRFAGARRGDWFTPACAPDDEEAMGGACAELLTRERRQWHLLALDRVDCESAWPEALWQGSGVVAPSPAGREDVLPYVRFEDGGYEAYIAGRSRNFRSQVGRRRRKLEHDHGLSFRMTSRPEDLGADLDGFFELHEERWRDRGGSSALSADAKELHRRFAAAALERGWLRLWTAEADGAPAAAWYGWRIGDRYCYSLSGLSERYERLALGTVLLAHTIEQAAAEGATTYDLMWGDEDYKQRFETGRRRARTWQVGRRGHPVRWAAVAGGRVVDRVRALPPGAREPLKRLYGAAARR
ncbi:MAG: GNAT family N-acetyltransferase [Thermoleophilaceae bacterium]